MWRWRIPSDLQTCDHQYIHIFHPGWLQFGSGPDFSHAILKIGDDWVQGDVEVHLQSQDWYLHGHAHDPAYSRVVLHVVWYHNRETYHRSRPDRMIPVLELSRYLQRTDIDELSHLELDGRPIEPRCRMYVQSWTDNALMDLLKEWGGLYMKSRSERFFPDERFSDREQLLFIQLTRALGYAHHKYLFQRMAELIPWSCFRAWAKEDAKGLLHGILRAFGWELSHRDRMHPIENIMATLRDRPPRRPGRMRPQNDPVRRLSWLVAFAGTASIGPDPLMTLTQFCREWLSSSQYASVFKKEWKTICMNVRTPLHPDSEFSPGRMGTSRWNTIWWNVFVPATLCDRDGDVLQYTDGLSHMDTGPIEVDWIQRLMARSFGFVSHARILRKPLIQLGFHGLYRSVCTRLDRTCLRCVLMKNTATPVER